MRYENKRYDAIALGLRIRSLRCDMKLSQKMFADNLRVNHDYITKIERGIKNPSIDLLIDIAQMASVSLDYLIFGRVEPADIGRRLNTVAQELLCIVKDIGGST